MERVRKGQEKRASYFIEAARSLIDEEGVEALSARKVGRRAGYSYATLYNYFADMDELIVACLYQTLEELTVAVGSRFDEEIRPIDQLHRGIDRYLDYFYAHPNRFHLVMVHPMPAKGTRETPPPLTRLMIEKIEACAGDKPLIGTPALLAELIGASLHGKLLFFFTGRSSFDGAALRRTVHEEIDRVIVRETKV